MRMMDELKHLFLYSSNKKVYVPINEKDRRRGSAILLLAKDLETSMNLMKLPYMNNPNLFTSFYVDRNVMAYIKNNNNVIDVEELDEVEEESISESMSLGWTSKINFNFESDVSIMDKRYIENVINYKEASYYANILGIQKMPKSVNIFIYPNLTTLQKSATKDIEVKYENKVYAYNKSNNIHVLSKLNYDEVVMGGSYETYLRTMMIQLLIELYNKGNRFVVVRGIALAMSGQAEWFLKYYNNYRISEYDKIAIFIYQLIKKDGYRSVIQYINTSDVFIFAKYSAMYVLSEKNKKNKKLIKESVSDIYPDEYNDILEICRHLSDSEFKKISFHDTYKYSPFVIKRIIHKIDDDPAGFIEVYHYPSRPDIAQIVIAVSDKYRGMGIADKMVSELLNSDLHLNHDFESYYWTAHTTNRASQMLAIKHGFIDTGKLDKYNRYIYIYPIKNNDITCKDVADTVNLDDKEFTVTESGLISKELSILFEDDSSKYSQRMKKYLYKERLKNNKSVLQIYDIVKSSNPIIKRSYMKINMYKRLNLFIDLSHYHGLFLKNNTYRLDRAVNFYFEFLNNLIDVKDIDDEYNKKTIFIPVDKNSWDIKPSTEIYDFKSNLNPISVIFRLVRTNPQELRRRWGNKDIVFVSSRGYFKVDFSKFELKDLMKFKRNLTKIYSNQPIEDDDEIDTLNDDPLQVNNISAKNIDSKKAMINKMIDKIEINTSINIDDTSSLDSNIGENKTHLQISSNPITFDDITKSDKNNTIVLSIDPDGVNGFTRISKTPLSNLSDIRTYCRIKK